MAQKQIPDIETTLDRDNVKSSEDYRIVRDTSTGSDAKTPAGSAGGYDVGTDNDEISDNDSARRVDEIDVAGDSDVTLTESQATARTLRLTGELTADIALIVPNAERVYQVINEATGGYSITVRTDTGTGVTIEKGTGGVAWLRSDGDDVVRMTGTADDEVPTNQDIESRQYDFDNMPQVDGNPIVESGSNSDGEWTRWADGTQICWITDINIGDPKATGDGTRGNPYSSSDITWDFPADFADDNFHFTGRLNNAQDSSMSTSQRVGTLTAYSLSNNSANTLRWVTLTEDTSDSDALVDLMAVGSWEIT